MSGRFHFHYHPTSNPTTLIGLAVLSMTIILIIFIGYSNQYRYTTQILQDEVVEENDQQLIIEDRFFHSNLPNNVEALQEKLVTLNKQYKSLLGYKEKLEKAYLNLKNEKASLIQADNTQKLEFGELKDVYTKQVQTLQDDLKSCRDQLHSFVLSSPQESLKLGSSAASNTISFGSGGSAGFAAAAVASGQFQVLPSPDQDQSNPQFVTNNTHPITNDILADQQPKSYQYHRSPLPNLIRNSISIVSNVLKEPIQSPIAQVPMEPAQPSSDPNQDLVGNVLI